MMKEPAYESNTLLHLLGRANELRRQKEYEAAVVLYLEAIEILGESVELFSVLAACYFAIAASNPDETGVNFDKALLWGKRAIALGPDRPHLLVNLAEYYSLGTLEYEKAAQFYRRAISINPNELGALVGAAALYGVPEKVVSLDEAIYWLERAVQLAPTNANYYLRLGYLYWEDERIIQAKTMWIRSLLCSEPLDSGIARVIKALEAES